MGILASCRIADSNIMLILCVRSVSIAVLCPGWPITFHGSNEELFVALIINNPLEYPSYRNRKGMLSLSAV